MFPRSRPNDDAAELALRLRALTVSIPEAQRISGYSRSDIYRRLGSGDLEAVKVGRATRILVTSIERSVASLPRAQFRAPKAA